MTLHMFRVAVSTSGMTQSELQQGIDQWVAEHQKWQDAPENPTVSLIRDLDTPTNEYYQVDIRFEKTDTKSNILQKLGDKLKNKVDWYRAGYHECDHDETDRSGCSWDDRVDWTDKDMSIPEYVPTFAGGTG